MTFDHWISDAVQVVEAVGAAIMVGGGFVVMIQFLVHVATRQADSYRRLRRNFGRVLQLGLEVLIVADIIRTIVVEPTLVSVGVLGAIVFIRILLSWALELEVDGTFPWQKKAEPLPRASGDGGS